ncbi:uncharacterized protein BX664DRAFT_321259 [Halteromyces radiatus]|uniref:uncharacterized protein n=1 Tax=Halteromyces radiatus TaxID=101107 RepID=UPI00221F3740|nr:uncharacterized protein BX664DRAFT_321259 [Halteromyces radiatus]KAI8099442.1 hypothetical protein BX664DRAFT_321259 [Halteromyces radiatus]
MSSTDTNSSSRNIIYKVYGIANKVQAITAIGFSTFAVIHGLQIAAGAVGGVEAADQALLLARPIYQDAHLEGYMVTGSVAAHLLAGLTKSSLDYCYLNNNKKNNKATGYYHGITGQLLIPLSVGHYILTRRMPIQTMGDSAFVDFGIVGWGLQNKPWVTWTWHVALIGVGVYHMVGGAPLAFRRTFGGKTTSKKEQLDDKKGSMVKFIPLVIGISTVLVAGLVATSRLDKIPLRREYQAIYNRLLPGWII